MERVRACVRACVRAQLEGGRDVASTVTRIETVIEGKSNALARKCGFAHPPPPLAYA